MPCLCVCVVVCYIMLYNVALYHRTLVYYAIRVLHYSVRSYITPDYTMLCFVLHYSVFFYITPDSMPDRTSRYDVDLNEVRYPLDALPYVRLSCLRLRRCRARV